MKFIETQSTQIVLPGLNEQIQFFMQEYPCDQKKGLIIGSGLRVAEKMFEEAGASVETIINDDSLLVTERLFSHSVKYMDYFATDFPEASFDFIYAQASISLPERNKIIKECLRILKPDGVFCAGEIIKRDNKTPQSVIDIWEKSGIAPPTLDVVLRTYAAAGFTVANSVDLTPTVVKVYRMYAGIFEDEKSLLTDEDIHYMRKDLKRLRHEVNLFIKMGAKKHMLYSAFLLRKSN